MGLALATALFIQEQVAPPGAELIIPSASELAYLFPTATDEDRTRIRANLSGWVEQHLSAGTSPDDLRLLFSNRLSVCQGLAAQDRFRAAAIRDPKFEPIALPDGYYNTLREEAISLLEFDLRNGLGRRYLSQDEISIVHQQISELVIHARRLLEAHLLGPDGMPIVEETTSRLQDSLLATVGPPFGAINGSLETADFSIIMAELEAGLASSPAIRYPSREEVDSATMRAEGQQTMTEGDGTSGTLAALALAEDKLFLVQRAFSAYIQASWPERALHARRLEGAYDDSMKYLRDAHRQHRSLITELAVNAVRSSVERFKAKSRKDAPGEPPREAPEQPRAGSLMRVEPGDAGPKAPAAANLEAWTGTPRWVAALVVAAAALVVILGLRRAMRSPA